LLKKSFREGREQGTLNREQFQELDGSDFSLVSNLNARFLSFHPVKGKHFFDLKTSQTLYL
jgi:hypothetical protein